MALKAGSVLLGGMLAAALMWTAPSMALESGQKRLHALTLGTAPAEGPDFKHFSWVNPNAPKGGTLRMGARGTFDTLNPFNVRGNKAAGLTLVYARLMTPSPDEPSVEYGLIAEWASHPDDYSSVTFGLRPGAKFQDGTPITPEDVIYSMEAMKKSDFYGQYYKNVVRGEKTGDNEVTFVFDTKGNRELPYITGELAIIPKLFWEGKSATGEPRDFTKTTLEIPVGSGPYRIKEQTPGRTIVYERVADWWGKDLPVSLGQWNFDTIRFEYFRDAAAPFEAFKIHDLDIFQESSAKQWATAYDLDAIKTGAMVKADLPNGNPPQMQAFALNLRRPQFMDERVRRAFILAFNFEWANKNLFYDQYARVHNFFGENDLKSSGLPQGRELEILETVRDGIPPQVFTTEYKLPVNNTDADFRQHQAEAVQLLAAAGWTQKGGKVVNAKGETLKAEFLSYDPQFDRIIQPYADVLRNLGMDISIRVVDTSQYQRRIDDFDYDIVVDTLAQSVSPGNEQRQYWGSASVNMKGSQNSTGISSPAIDKLIDAIIFSKDRADLAAATRALDRVLLWSNIVVPQWYSPSIRVAYWNTFGKPDKLASRDPSIVRTWWFDPRAAQKPGAAGTRNTGTPK